MLHYKHKSISVMTQKTTRKPRTRTHKRRPAPPATFWQRFVRRVKLLLVPHQANQYRPHLVRRYGLLSVLMLVIGVQFGYNAATTGHVLGQHEPVSVVELAADTNAQRAAFGLSPLRNDDRLAQAAYLKGKDMLAKQYWAHQAPDGTTPWYWFNASGYNYTYAGENLAKNFTSADAAVAAWMASPGHRANVLDAQYSDVGFAVVDGTLKGKPTSVIVAMYGAPAATQTSSVAGSRSTALIVDAPAPHTLGVMARVNVAAQSISPAAIGGMFLIILASIVAAVAQLYYKQLPRALRESWYKHHGSIKAGGMLSVGVVMLLIYSGGQL